MYGFLMDQQQYRNAYPTIPYQQPPNASNGYGWHGNGYGWQVDNIDQNRTGLEEVEIQEPVLSELKVEQVTRGVRIIISLPIMNIRNMHGMCKKIYKSKNKYFGNSKIICKNYALGKILH